MTDTQTKMAVYPPLSADGSEVCDAVIKRLCIAKADVAGMSESRLLKALSHAGFIFDGDELKEPWRRWLTHHGELIFEQEQ